MNNYRADCELWCELPKGFIIKEIKIVSGRVFVETDHGIYDCTDKGSPILITVYDEEKLLQ